MFSLANNFKTIFLYFSVNYLSFLHILKGYLRILRCNFVSSSIYDDCLVSHLFFSLHQFISSLNILSSFPLEVFLNQFPNLFKQKVKNCTATNYYMFPQRQSTIGPLNCYCSSVRTILEMLFLAWVSMSHVQVVL